MAQPDGYILLVTTPSLAISPSLYKKLNYDAIRDLAPIPLVAEVPNLPLVRPSLPVKSLKEFMDIIIRLNEDCESDRLHSRAIHEHV